MDKDAERERDRELSRRAARQDRSAFAELYERHAEGVRRLLLARGAPEEAAWDLVQETFTRALRHLDRGRGPDRFDLWIRRIALNASADHWRTPHVLREESADPWTLPEAAARDPDWAAGEAIRQAIRSLDKALRDAVILHFYEDLSVQEAAEVLRIPPGTVKSRLSRAYRRLATTLGIERETQGRVEMRPVKVRNLRKGGNEA